MTARAIPAAPPTARVLLAYGQLGLPLAVLTLPFYVLLPGWYADGLGLGLAAVGGALLAARLWDVVSDPLIGLLSDRTGGRYGRRRPWLVAGLLPLLAGTWLLFLPPAGMGVGGLLGASLLFYLGATMVTLPWLAWGAELTGDHHGRSRVTGVREGFVVVGTVVAAALTAMNAAEPGTAMAHIGLFLIVALPLSVMLATLLTPDRPPSQRSALDWRAGGRLLAGNRPFRLLLLAWLVNGLANGLPATLFLLFVGYRIGAPEQAGLFLLLYFGAGLAGIPFWLAASRRLGKHRAWLLAMAAACLFFAAVPLLGTGDLVAYGVVCLLTGACLGADLALPPSMQADVVDIDTERAGRPRTGLFFALWNIATKLALALAVGIAFPLLELAGFATGGAANDGRALAALSALYGLAPIACKLAAIGLVWRYGAAMSTARGTVERQENGDATTPLVGTRFLTHHNGM